VEELLEALEENLGDEGFGVLEVGVEFDHVQETICTRLRVVLAYEYVLLL